MFGRPPRRRRPPPAASALPAALRPLLPLQTNVLAVLRALARLQAAPHRCGALPGGGMLPMPLPGPRNCC